MRVVSASGLRLRRHIHRHLLFPMTWHVLRRLWEDALSCLLPILPFSWLLPLSAGVRSYRIRPWFD